MLFILCFLILAKLDAHVPSPVSLGSSWTFPSPRPILELQDFSVSFNYCTLTVHLSSPSPNEPDEPIWWARGEVQNKATLTLQQDGNLVQRHPDGRISWQTGTAYQGVTTMHILHNGNLVLLTDNKYVVWQSFDFPTNTLMLNQQLKVGGTLKSLPHSKSGFFLQVEAYGVYLYAKRFRSKEERYASFCEQQGREISYIMVDFDALKCFGNSSQLLGSVAFSVVAESYLQFSSRGDLLHVLGWKKESLVTPVDVKCGGPVAACGGNGYCTRNGQCSCFFDASFSFVDQSQPTEGCDLTAKPECNVTNNGLRLVAYPGVTNLVAEFNHKSAVSVASVEMCRSLCLENCSCNGVVFYHQTNVCMVFTDFYTSWNSSVDSIQATTFFKVGVTKLESRKVKKQHVALSIILTCVLFICLSSIVRTISKLLRQKHGLVTPNLLQQFEYKDLVEMTHNFNTQLGEGGFGTVFSGVLHDGNKVAVKQMRSASEGMKQFEAEVRSIGSIHHKNLVKLLGYTAHENNFFLIYEFLQNMSLDRWLFTAGCTLDWHTRFHIAIDIARGLHYLHEGCQEQVLHLDIKPQNILLDATFQAKICDFGLSRLVNREGQSINLNLTLRGTPGYMAPEWLTGKVSDKTDVYSFGIVLLEIVTGRKAAPMLPTGQSASLVRIESLQDANTLIQHIDQRFSIEFHVEHIKRVVLVGISCVADEPHERPTMAQALQMLEATI